MNLAQELVWRSFFFCSAAPMVSSWAELSLGPHRLHLKQGIYWTMLYLAFVLGWLGSVAGTEDSQERC